MPQAVPADSPPVRDAATVMIVRDSFANDAGAIAGGSSQLEVLMLRRNLQSAFVGGVHLFPGGAVDEADSSFAAGARCLGLDDAVASARLGVGSGGLGLWFAVVRECFEECGLLLATTPDGAWPDWASQPAAFAALRDRAASSDSGFAELLSAAGLFIPADRVHYWSRWVTPVGAVRRYDTRFFVCAAPPHQQPQHDAVEAIAHLWARPAHMVEQNDLGNIALVTPTRKSLEALARFRSVDELLTAAAHDIAQDGPVASLIPTGAAPIRPAGGSDAVRQDARGARPR